MAGKVAELATGIGSMKMAASAVAVELATGSLEPSSDISWRSSNSAAKPTSASIHPSNKVQM